MRPKESEVYKRIKMLGQGSYGKAYLCQCLKDNSLCVIKQMDLRYLSEEERKETYQEFRIMSHLHHPNIINFREVYKTVKGKLCIVMDYAEGGDLAQIIKKQEGHFQESKILDWFTQMCLAVKHCHDRKIIHRDIKTQNMFLSRDMRIRLGDFGIARLLDNTRAKVHTMVGTPYYLAPELLENKPYSFKGDVWSLGIILYEMCAKQPPFNGESLAALALKIVRGQFQPIPSQYSHQLKTLVNTLLVVNPDKRPTVHQILKMPIITNRIKNFLSETMKHNEFDHTILHNQQIHLTDTTIPLIDDQDLNPQETVQKPKISQLPGIQSPAINVLKHRKFSDLKKLPEIKLPKQEKPPMTRQQSSRQYIQQLPSQRVQPSTPEVGLLCKQKNGRFITKESPDSFQGSDQIVEDIPKNNSEQGSPHFFQHLIEQKNNKNFNNKGISKLERNQQIKSSQKSDDELKKPMYRVHAQPKLLEKFLKKQRKVSEEIITTNRQNEQQSQPLENIPETPEQKLLLDKTTISDFANSEEQQQQQQQQQQQNNKNKKSIIETTPFDFQNQLFPTFDVTKKKPNKQIKIISKTDEDKSKKKIYKIIYKDPFQQKKDLPKKRNSEEDMKNMIDELKNVLDEKIELNKKDIEPLNNDSDASHIYSESSSDDLRDDGDSIPPQTQINTWMNGDHPVNTSKSQPEPRSNSRNSNNSKSLKDQLIHKLGSHFDKLYKLARLCSRQEDLGKQHIKITIMENLNFDENAAELYATLLITIATRGY